MRPGPRSLLLPCFFLLLSTGPALAQARLSVAGIVLEEDGGTPVESASVLLAGQRVATAGSGMFIITDVAPGDYTLVVEALGYIRYEVDLVLRADTTLRIVLAPQPVSLEAVVVRGITISGTIHDAETGLRVLGGSVTVEPGEREDGATNGRFSVSGVPPGRVAVTARVLEYLPSRVEFDASRDTVLRFDMVVDSVAIRMIERQVQRLADRAEEVPMRVTAVNRRDIELLGFPSAFHVLRHHIPNVVPSSPPWPDVCILLDEAPTSIGAMIGLQAELIERIEIFGFRASGIRVYTKRYVARLMGQRRLRPNAMLEC